MTKGFSIYNVFSKNSTITLADLNRGTCVITIPKRSNPNETAEKWELDRAEQYNRTHIRLITKPINNFYCIFKQFDTDDDDLIVEGLVQEYYIPNLESINSLTNHVMSKNLLSNITNVRIYCTDDKANTRKLSTDILLRGTPAQKRSMGQPGISRLVESYLGGKSHRKKHSHRKKKRKRTTKLFSKTYSQTRQ